MWTNNYYVIPSESDKDYNYPEIKVEMDDGIISISQSDLDSEFGPDVFDTIDMTIDQAMKLKSILEQYLQGK
ncbi:hypothetical protein [Providencia phage PSTRCR_127]|nr:hypothetical protein [Providencia phage PSTRCR_127]